LRNVLKGQKAAFRDAVVMTAGAALLMDSKATSFADGVRAAEAAIDSGAGLAALDRLIKVSNS